MYSIGIILSYHEYASAMIIKSNPQEVFIFKKGDAFDMFKDWIRSLYLLCKIKGHKIIKWLAINWGKKIN